MNTPSFGLTRYAGSHVESDLLGLTNDLIQWAREDETVKLAIAKLLDSRGYVSLGHLAHENPDLLLEFYDAMHLMRIELPYV